MLNDNCDGSSPFDFEALLREWDAERPEVLRTQAHYALSGFSFGGWVLPSHWFEGVSPFQRPLYEFLCGFNHVAFERLTPNARRILWKGVLLHQHLTEEEIPYPANLLALDHEERAAAVAAEREAAGRSETPASTILRKKPRRAPHPSWAVGAFICVVASLMAFAVGLHEGSSEVISDWSADQAVYAVRHWSPPSKASADPRPLQEPLLPPPNVQH